MFATSLLAISTTLGCSKNPSKPSTSNNPNVNSDSPNGNSRIASQQVVGDASRATSIWELEPSDRGYDLLTAEYENNLVIGRLTGAGSLMWRVQTQYTPRGFHVLSASSPVPGGSITVGSFDTNNKPTLGYATLVNSTGSVASELLYSSDSSNVWLDDVAPLSDSLFVVVGGERTATRENPLVALLALTASGTLEKRQQAVISSIAGRYAFRVATDPGDALSATRRIYFSTRDPYPNMNTLTLHGLDIASATLAPWAVAWTQTLAGKGAGSWEEDLTAFGGAVYVAGSINDPDKGPPQSGVYWSSGLVARVSSAGAVTWAKIVTPSRHVDQFEAVEATASTVTAIGFSATYFTTPSNDAFGYGWVAQFVPGDGSALTSFTFGDPSYASGFNSAYYAGSSLVVGGWTQKESSGVPYRGWRAVLNLSPAVGNPAVMEPAPVRPGEAPLRERHGRAVEM